MCVCVCVREGGREGGRESIVCEPVVVMVCVYCVSEGSNVCVCVY